MNGLKKKLTNIEKSLSGPVVKAREDERGLTNDHIKDREKKKYLRRKQEDGEAEALIREYKQTIHTSGEDSD